MRERRVLIASPHHWTSPLQLGGHHLARAFAGEGWRVAYISNPISPLHLGRGRTRDVRARFALYRRGGLRDMDGRVWAYVPAALLTPNRGPVLSSRWLHRHWDRLTVPKVASRVAYEGFDEVDLLLIDTAVQAFWLDAIPHGRSVLRVGDRMAAFGQFTAEMSVAQRELASRVDVVAYSARSLLADVQAMGARRTLYLPNGVDVPRFTADPAPAPPPDLASVNLPVAIYVGAMDAWFDFNLVNQLAASIPEVAFVLIGPADLARMRLTVRPNLHILGSRSYDSLPGYLHRASIGLIPFDVNGFPDLVHSIHPLKLYEYLASGLPVVATRWDELEAISSPAILCSGLDEWITAIRRAVSTPPDPAAGRAFAVAADWRDRVRRLVSVLA